MREPFDLRRTPITLVIDAIDAIDEATRLVDTSPYHTQSHDHVTAVADAVASAAGQVDRCATFVNDPDQPSVLGCQSSRWGAPLPVARPDRCRGRGLLHLTAGLGACAAALCPGHLYTQPGFAPRERLIINAEPGPGPCAAVNALARRPRAGCDQRCDDDGDRPGSPAPLSDQPH